MKKLRQTLSDLGMDKSRARGIESMLFLWEVMFLSHPAVAGQKEVPISEGDLLQWERFYEDESLFKREMPIPKERVEEIAAMVRAEDSISALKEVPEVAHGSEMQQTLWARFARLVIGPYMLWHRTDPWHDFQAACNGDDKALCRLVEIDPTVLDLPRIQKVWASRLKEDRNLRDRVRDSKERKVADKIDNPRTFGKLFQKDTRKRDKLRLAAEIQRWVEQRCKKKLNAAEIRQIFDAFARDTRQGERDEDLPEWDESFRKDINNWRKRI